MSVGMQQQQLLSNSHISIALSGKSSEVLATVLSGQYENGWSNRKFLRQDL